MLLLFLNSIMIRSGRLSVRPDGPPLPHCSIPPSRVPHPCTRSHPCGFAPPIMRPDHRGRLHPFAAAAAASTVPPACLDSFRRPPLHCASLLHRPPCCTKSVCCKHMFQVFQLFHRYVAKVDLDVTYIAWLYTMLKVSIQNVSSTLDVCYKCFI
jgi:hypothetical protein